jgi:hypothetical protein
VDIVLGVPKIRIDGDGDVQMVKTQRAIPILWTLQTPGYEFHDDSISPHATAPIPPKGTTSPQTWYGQVLTQHVAGPNNYILVDRNDLGVTLYYDVKLYRAGSDIVAARLDPAIMNDP